MGLEPTTYRLTADRSAIELPRTDYPGVSAGSGDLPASPASTSAWQFAHSSTHFRGLLAHISEGLCVTPPRANPKRFCARIDVVELQRPGEPS